jgi:hypothetical protein
VLVGWRLILNQPSPATILALDSLALRYKGVISRLDIAVDVPAADLQDQVRQTAVLRWRPKGQMYDSANVTYWIDYRNRRPYRNLAVYADKASRITGEACVHLELRFMRAQSVRAQGIHRPRDLLNINPQALFDKHIKWSDAGTKHVQIMSRKAVQQAQNPRMISYALHRSKRWKASSPMARRSTLPSTACSRQR